MSFLQKSKFFMETVIEANRLLECSMKERQGKPLLIVSNFCTPMKSS